MLPLSEWWKRIGDETMDLLIHFSFSNIWMFVMFVMMPLLVHVVSISSITVFNPVKTTLRSIWDEWKSASDSGVKWWEISGGESVNLLIHASLGNVFIVVLVLVLGQRSIMSRWVRSVGDESSVSVLPLSEWRKRISDEAMNLLVHFSLGNIGLSVMLVMMLLLVHVMSISSVIVLDTFESLWVGTIRNEWEVASFPSVKWWHSIPNELMHISIHTSLSIVFMSVLLMML